MKFLIIGSGGREHTFAWKLSGSPKCEAIFTAPGNAGTAQLGKNLAIDPMDFQQIKKAVLRYAIDLVIVGPEAPLVAGIVDFFRADEALAAIPVIGPDQRAAQLEGSKAFAKTFMQQYNIPTAAYKEFTLSNRKDGIDYLQKHSLPVVIKADGLAAGKGVLICTSQEEAVMEFNAMLDGKFGQASQKVIVEEFLDGIEFSVFIYTNGTDYVLLPEAKDYKKIREGDQGLNTGGMGAISPVPFVNDQLMDKVRTEVIERTLSGLQKENIHYNGFIFFGLMLVNEQTYVIEYNCRMGDPETEVVLPRIENDLLDFFELEGGPGLKDVQIRLKEEAFSTVIMVSGGYPQAYEKGKKITGLEEVQDSMVFHAGTKVDDGQIITNGGRVLAVTSSHTDFRKALEQSYKNTRKIQFDGKYYRTDIGFDL